MNDLANITTEWMTGWTAQAPLSLDFNFVSGKANAWIDDALTGMESRDLGLGAASAEKLSARHVRVADLSRVAREWRCFDGDFQFFYILKGQVKVENAAGDVIELPKGTSVWQPARYCHRLFDFSADFEMLELLGPARPRMIVGDDAVQAELSTIGSRVQEAKYLFETPASFVQGAGPRKYFEYRDLGTTVPTDGRIHIHIVRAIEAMPGGTGWHNHTMRQLFWVMRGSAGMFVEDHPEIRQVESHDAMCVAAGLRHDVFDISADYAVIEVCIPAEYETSDTDAPHQGEERGV